METLAGISETNRRYLTHLHRHTNGLVDVQEAAGLLGMSSLQAAKLLASLSTRGWARRLRRGLYLLIPLDATSPEDWSEDAWIVAERLFKPAYIAGWSACEHWGFTEQVFHDVAVFTTRSIRQRQITVDRTTYVLKKVPGRLMFGTQNVWRKETRVLVSDPTRTLIDILDDPKWGGGIRHVAQVVDEYLASNHRSDTLLLEYLGRVDHSAAAKRLGYLLEHSKREIPVSLAGLQSFITTGFSLLDPSVPAAGPYVSKWNLRVNVDVRQ